jgi:hypothetical protein
MPSATHQALVALLLERPELLTATLGTGPSLPGSVRIRAASAAFTDLTPPSYHADMVLRVEDDRGRLRHLFIGEVQLRRDRRKHISWPIYVTAARAEVGLDCPVTLVVVALTPAVARWCAQPIPLDTQGGSIVPLVLGPEDIPQIVDVETARAHPELAVLSAVAHAHSKEAPEIAAAALVACGTLDSRHGSLYADLVEAQLDPNARRAVEEHMYTIDGFPWYRLQSPRARAEWLAVYEKGQASGRKEGREEGREKGHKQGLREGQREGQRQALARMLTVQLEQRFGSLPMYAVKAIATADADALIKMGSRVLGAASVKAVVAPPARRPRARGTASGTRSRKRASSKATGTRPRRARAAPPVGAVRASAERCRQRRA